MKTFVVFIIWTIIALFTIRIVEFCKLVKIHKKRIEEMNELIVELKKKQIVLNQKVNIFQQSTEYQKTQINSIHSKINSLINKHLSEL